MIQQVEGFEAKLKIRLLFNREAFEERRIQFVGSILENVRERSRESTDVILQRVGGFGIEYGRVEGRGVGLAVVKVERPPR